MWYEESQNLKLKKTLSALVGKIYDGRDDDMNPVLEYVVVEKDWPEYEPTWQAIEKRVTKT